MQPPDATQRASYGLALLIADKLRPPVRATTAAVRDSLTGFQQEATSIKSHLAKVCRSRAAPPDPSVIMARTCD